MEQEMDKTLATIEQYYVVLDKLQKAIDNGRWQGMDVVIEVGKFEHDQCISRISWNNDRTDFVFSGSRMGTCILGSRIWDEVVYTLLIEILGERYNGCQLKEVCQDMAEFNENYMFAWLDAEYLAKRYLTGTDYEHYERNPDIEIDEYGVMYNTRTNTLLKFVNNDIREYWVKDGTKTINQNTIDKLPFLHTIVFPSSLLEIPMSFYKCDNLARIVITGRNCKIWGAPNNLSAKCKVFIPENYEEERYVLGNVYVYDSELLDKGIITSKTSGLTFRQLKCQLDEIDEKYLDCEVRIWDNGEILDSVEFITKYDIPNEQDVYSDQFDDFSDLLGDILTTENSFGIFKNNPAHSSWLSHKGEPYFLLSENFYPMNGKD